MERKLLIDVGYLLGTLAPSQPINPTLPPRRARPREPRRFPPPPPPRGGSRASRRWTTIFWPLRWKARDGGEVAEIDLKMGEDQ